LTIILKVLKFIYQNDSKTMLYTGLLTTKQIDIFTAMTGEKNSLFGKLNWESPKSLFKNFI